MKRILLTGLAWMGLVVSAEAQFHSKAGDGRTTVNQQAVNQAGHQAASLSSATGSSQLGTNLNSTIYMSETQREAMAKNRLRMGQQDTKPIHVWGRRIQHSDDTYTTSVEDERKRSVTQTTFSKNGTRLQYREILLDEWTRPKEVMIYGGRGEFKYRGMLVYDQMGRFIEEQIFDTESQLIRRKVQEYAPDGQKLPLRSVDYVENVPEDLQLVITRENEDPSSVPPQGDGGKKGLFGQSKPQEPTVEPLTGATEKRKGGGLGRLFGAKKE